AFEEEAKTTHSSTAGGYRLGRSARTAAPTRAPCRQTQTQALSVSQPTASSDERTPAPEQIQQKFIINHPMKITSLTKRHSDLAPCPNARCQIEAGVARPAADIEQLFSRTETG